MPYSVSKGPPGKRKVSFKCERCEEVLTTKLESAGESVECPTCKNRLTVPGLPELNAQHAEVAKAKTLKALNEREQALAAERKAAATLGEQRDPLPPRSRREIVTARLYEYRMIEIPPGIVLKTRAGGEAAGYLEDIVEEQADLGWEFYRIDTIGVRVPAGCLAFLLGQGDQIENSYVVTFRRPPSITAKA